MLNRLLSILVLNFGTCGAYAAAVDNCALPECHVQKVRLDARNQKLQAGISPAFGSIVKKDATSEKYCSDHSKAGEVCYMTQKDAIDYCASQQNHLPSMREIALNLHNEFGAKGIVKSCENVHLCKHINAVNLLDNSADWFEYSYSGYTQPKGDLVYNWFWSSSVNQDDDYYGFIIDGYNGYADSHWRITGGYRSAVRCAVGPKIELVPKLGGI